MYCAANRENRHLGGHTQQHPQMATDDARAVGSAGSSASSSAATSSSGDSDTPNTVSVSAASALVEDEHGEQPLQTPWTFWFDRASAGAPYAEALQRLGTVHTVQGFWRYYCNLTRPAQLQPGDNYHLFRGALQPAQEMLPGGGCWSLRVPHGKAAVDVSEGAGAAEEEDTMELVNLYWEKLLLCLVGESIGESCVAGAGVSVRKEGSVIAIWCRKADASARRRVAEALARDVFGDAAIEWRAIGGAGATAAAATAAPPRRAAAAAPEAARRVERTSEC